MWTETRFLQERTGSDKGLGQDDFKVRHIPDRGPCDVMWDHKTEGAIVSDPQLDATDVKKNQAEICQVVFRWQRNRVHIWITNEQQYGVPRGQDKLLTVPHLNKWEKRLIIFRCHYFHT